MKTLHGSWRLESIEYRVDGEQIHPFGQHPIGRLIYSDTGHMSAILAKRERTPIGFSPDMFQVPGFSGIKKLSGLLRYMRATMGVLSYSGRYRQEGNQIIHRVDVASYPDLQGIALVRLMRIEGDLLVLEAQDSPGCFGQLFWQRETHVESI